MGMPSYSHSFSFKVFENTRTTGLKEQQHGNPGSMRLPASSVKTSVISGASAGVLAINAGGAT